MVRGLEANFLKMGDLRPIKVVSEMAVPTGGYQQRLQATWHLLLHTADGLFLLPAACTARFT